MRITFYSNTRVHTHFAEPTGSPSRRAPKSSCFLFWWRDLHEEKCGTDLVSKSMVCILSLGSFLLLHYAGHDNRGGRMSALKGWLVEIARLRKFCGRLVWTQHTHTYIYTCWKKCLYVWCNVFLLLWADLLIFTPFFWVAREFQYL